MVDYDLISMKVFVSVIQSGSLTQAARELDLATSAISKRITELEGKVGTALLYRYPRGVSPTSAGLIFFRHAQHILREVNQLALVLQPYVEGENARLRCAANAASMPSLLDQCLLFRKQVSEVDFSLQEISSDRVMEAVLNGVVDLGIVSKSYLKNQVESVFYEEGRLGVCMPVTNLFAKKKSVSMADLTSIIESTLFISCTAYADIMHPLTEHIKLTGVSFCSTVELSSFIHLFNLVYKGMGVGIIPMSLKEYAKQGVVCVPINGELAVYELVIVSLMQGEKPAQIKKFLQHITPSGKHAPRKNNS